ncbi:MAG: site-specific integrase [Clostridia bacterium]|nr:site-specific integrase [Clostridia bacterium]
MICKYCKKEIENDSVYCRFCGERVIRARKKAKDQISVPAPVQTPEGKYRGRLMVKGQRVYVTEGTEAAYYVRARAVKAGLIEQDKSMPKDILRNLVEKYIDDNAAVLSPSTVASYKSLMRNAFPAYMGQSISVIPWQKAVSDETERASAKTVRNGWRLVTASLKYAKQSIPTVSLPKIVRNERTFLDYEQIQRFISAIKGDPCELTYLLALHSLRLSEILALRSDSISDNMIYVRGAMVRAAGGQFIRKDLNKTELSRRDIPVMISRINKLRQRLPISLNDKTFNDHLRKICRDHNLPDITLHCLRHSFASLAYHLRWTEKSVMQLGGWSTPDVVHSIYTHLSSKEINEDVERMRAFYTQD